jgi:hypothetical protein
MLKNIIENTFGPLGLDPQRTEDRLLLVKKINFAAKELWDETDLIGSLQEQFFVTTDENQVTFPYYVYQIRGLRSVNTNGPFELKDMSPRYYYGAGYDSNIEWRLLPKSPIERNISNSAPMTISVPVAETVRVRFTVRGRTTNSQKLSETVTLEVGETAVAFTQSFEDVLFFHKDVVTTNDCTMRDADLNTIAVIPNALLKSLYCVAQIRDPSFDNTISNNATFQLLFKQLFVPFVNDDDEYPVEDYDDAIVWKTLSHFYATKEGQEGLAAAYAGQVLGLLRTRDADASRGIVKPVQVRANRFIKALNSYGFFGRRSYSLYGHNP